VASLRRVLLHAILVANLLAQSALAALGVAVAAGQTAEATIVLLALWATGGVGYLLCVVVAVTVVSRPPRTRATEPVPGLYRGRVAHVIGVGSTVLASVCGVVGAGQVTFQYSDAGVDGVGHFVGVAAILISWALLHWGYALYYYRRYHRSPRPILAFPETPTPRLSDFVYFAVTVGTSFATSDTQVLSPRLRWAVTKHAVLSFFYNGAIIVLAFNTLKAAG
jgi:uncharacterized membrane protein